MNGQCFLRVSFQGYNSWEDGERLLTALTEILKG
jgi:selenocysteine lyase/cysteine desulfurase